jgi:hypothetical protein
MHRIAQVDVSVGSFASISACPGYVRLRGNPGSAGPAVLPEKGIGLSAIQASKPEAQNTRHELADCIMVLVGPRTYFLSHWSRARQAPLPMQWL